MHSKQTNIKALAAAGLAACSLAGVAEQAEAEVVWTPGSSEYVGTYNTVAGISPWDLEGNLPGFEIDFDQDGVPEFHLYYYSQWAIAGYRLFNDGYSYLIGAAPMNPSSDVIVSSAEQNQTSSQSIWFADSAHLDTLDEVYQTAMNYAPLSDEPWNGVSPPRVSTSLNTDDPWNSGDERFAERGYWSGIFSDDEGREFVGYIDMQIFADSQQYVPGTFTYLEGDGSLVIYDIGYTQIPEPGSLALLVAPGLLLMRRRRA